MKYVKSITEDAKEEHRNIQTIQAMEQELLEYRLKTYNYLNNIVLIKGLKEIISNLRLKYFAIGEMLKSKSF